MNYFYFLHNLVQYSYMKKVEKLNPPVVSAKPKVKVSEGIRFAGPAMPKPKIKEFSNAELMVALEQNAFLLEENNRLTKRLYRHMVFSQIMFWIKFLLVAISLALALNYLPPFMSSLAGLYKQATQAESQLKLR